MRVFCMFGRLLFRVFFETVQDCLPAVALHVEGVFRFGVEGFADFGLVAEGFEEDFDLAAVGHGVGNAFVVVDAAVGAFEVEAEAVVFGGHDGFEFAVDAEVVFGFGRVPIVGSLAPINDVLRFGPELPNFFDRRVDCGFDSDWGKHESLGKR